MFRFWDFNIEDGHNWPHRFRIRQYFDPPKEEIDPFGMILSVKKPFLTFAGKDQHKTTDLLRKEDWSCDRG